MLRDLLILATLYICLNVNNMMIKMVILILFNTVHYSFNSQQLCHKYYYCWKSRNKKDFSFLLVQTMIVIQQKYIHKHFYHHLVTYILPTHSLHILLDCTCHLLLTHKEKLGALRQKDKKNNKLQLIQYLPLHFCFVFFFILILWKSKYCDTIRFNQCSSNLYLQ